MSAVIQVGSSWPRFPGVRRLFIFGDSYSSIGLEYAPSGYCRPSAIQPLGMPFPGITYNEPELPNWVGHLLTNYVPGPRFKPGKAVEQDKEYLNDPLLAFVYARGGDTIMGVKRQIQKEILPNAGKKPSWAPWESDSSIFITWVGINNCAFSREHTDNVTTLFGLQEELYNAGARNFMFIDVPPIHRSPAVPAGRSDESAAFDNFNSHLGFGARTFAMSHPDVTVMLFSAAATFNCLLDDPLSYGFKPSDSRAAGGGIWHDRLHPTSKVHDYIANDLADLLGSVEKCQPASEGIEG